MMEFCKAFNAETANFIPNTPMQVPPHEGGIAHTQQRGGERREKEETINHAHGRRRRQTVIHTCPCVADVVCVWMGEESSLGRAGGGDLRG
jgi:hypothetical protein